jgi:hypothetical protein
MTPQEAANRAAEVLAKAEDMASPGRVVDGTGTAMALATVADSWTRLAEALAQNPAMVSSTETRT